jgi:GMP synthase-like glutamine amidotransferase
MRANGPLLILRHEPFEHLGTFASILDENRVAYEYHDLGEPLAPDNPRGVIIMGGPMSANDDLPGLRDELALIERALGEHVPVLGICLGSQLIAKVLGAKVYANEQLEIGWAPVWRTDAAADDALFGRMETPETFFHWHGETFDLPSGAELLAYSEKCRHQAYRYGRRVYGIQFHPEVNAEMIADWCEQPVNCGDVATIEGPIDPHLHDPRESSRRIIESWLDLF